MAPDLPGKTTRYWLVSFHENKFTNQTNNNRKNQINPNKNKKTNNHILSTSLETILVQVLSCTILILLFPSNFNIII